MFSAKRFDVLCVIQNENFSVPLEAHNYHVQVKVRQLEQEAEARFSQRQSGPSSRSSQEANQALQNQQEILLTEATIRSMEAR